MTWDWHTFFDWTLTAAYMVAALRLGHAAVGGRQAISLFRIVGVVICVAWAGYYFMLGLDHLVDVVNPHWWTNVERGIQYFNVMLFLVWGFLFNEAKWTARMTEDS